MPEIDHETDLHSFNEKLKQSLTESAIEVGALRIKKIKRLSGLKN